MKLDGKVARTILGALRLPAFVALALAVSSGQLGWARMWILVGLIVAGMAVNLPLLARRNPELLRERFEKRQDTQGFDKLFAALAALTLLSFLVVAGIDAGRRGSELPLWAMALGMGLHFLGDVPIAWAMATNRHLEATVRIQTERGHQVVDRGPYRLVRHPMYSGMLLMFSGWPLVLGSLWSYLPLALFAAALVWRTLREDRALQEGLAGYLDYASRTRYRLVPGLW